MSSLSHGQLHLLKSPKLHSPFHRTWPFLITLSLLCLSGCVVVCLSVWSGERQITRMADMAPKNMHGVFLLLILFVLRLGGSDGQMVPAVFVLGDSLVDVGNNNYLPLSIAKADFQHNGIDFLGKKPTGRFCNGKNAADFLGASTSMPKTHNYYLSVLSYGNSKSHLLPVMDLNYTMLNGQLRRWACQLRRRTSHSSPAPPRTMRHHS